MRCLQRGLWLLSREEARLALLLDVNERVAPVRREDIVLGPGVPELVERNTLGFAACSDALVRLGMSGRKGVLLYGPPEG